MMGNILEFCQNMDIPLNRLSVQMEGKRESNPSRIGEISASIEIEGDIPEERVETLRRVVKGCRIHNTFTKPPKIGVNLTVNENKPARPE